MEADLQYHIVIDGPVVSGKQSFSSSSDPALSLLSPSTHKCHLFTGWNLWSEIRSHIGDYKTQICKETRGNTVHEMNKIIALEIKKKQEYRATEGEHFQRREAASFKIFQTGRLIWMIEIYKWDFIAQRHLIDLFERVQGVRTGCWVSQAETDLLTPTLKVF